MRLTDHQKSIKKNTRARDEQREISRKNYL